MAAFNPSGIARRVRSLVERRDNGDEAAAARRLGITADALAELLGGSFEHLNLDTLGAIMDGYEVDAIWLLTGERACRQHASRWRTGWRLRRLWASSARAF